MAILSCVSRVDPVAAYRSGIVLVIAFFVAAAVSAALLTARPVPAVGADQMLALAAGPQDVRDTSVRR